jgi:hypothetical protein
MTIDRNGIVPFDLCRAPRTASRDSRLAPR